MTTTQAQSPAPAAASSSTQSASLYVGDLAPEVTEPEIHTVFSAVGPLESVRVCRDSATRRSLGYAYVNFYKVEDAERALDTLNFKPIRDRPCRIMWSHRDPSLRKSGVGNIYVKNLAKSIDNKTLFDTFSVFGNILSCKVAYSPKGEHLGYGFVHFETGQAATDAIARVDGKVIADEKVSVMAFKSKKDRGVDKKTRFTNLYVKNLPADFSKEKLDELFRKHGTVTSSMLALDKGEKKRGAYAFVNFAAPEEANSAMVALNNFELDKEHKMYVGRAQKKEERMKELRQRFEAAKAERIKKWQGVNLYVKNLPDDWTDEKLVAEFKHCGAISSTKVMRDATTTKSRGFGFVCFTTPDEAQKAVSDMNGKQVDGKPLYVALAQRKELRRATLENRRMHRGGNMGFGQGPQMGGYPGGNPMFYGDNRGGFPNMYGGPGGQMGGGMGRGWGPMQGGQGGMMPRQGGYGGFNPMMGRGGPQGAGSPGGRGGRGGGGRGGPRGGGGPGMGGGRGMGRGGMGGQPPSGGRGEFKDNQPQVQYAENVRNPQARPMQQPPAMQQQMPEAMLPRQQGEALTIKALAAAPEKQQKQMIGEQLFPRIKSIEPKLAGKITGMLLEMDNGELIHLLESQEALQEKVSEAKEVLEGHERAADQEEQQDE